MVDTGFAGEEAAHKEYIVHLPPKWQKFHERDGHRASPLLKKMRHSFVHVLANSAASESAMEHAPTAATNKLSSSGKQQRLQSLLLLKQETEEKEHARSETLRLARMVSKQKDKIQARREKAMHEGNVLVLSAQCGTALQLKKVNELHQKHHDKYAGQLGELLQKQNRNTERRIHDAPEGGTVRQGNIKLLACARKAMAEGVDNDAFLKPVGKKFTEPDAIRRAATDTLNQVGQSLHENQAKTLRYNEQKENLQKERVVKLHAAARKNHEKMRDSSTKRGTATTKRINFAVKHCAHHAEACIYKNVEPMYDNMRNKIDVVQARQDLIDEATQKQTTLDQQWQQYEDELTTKFHWTLNNVASNHAHTESTQQQSQIRQIEGDKRIREAHQRKTLLCEDRKELWKGRDLHEDTVGDRRNTCIQGELSRNTGKINKIREQQEHFATSPKVSPKIQQLPLRTAGVGDTQQRTLEKEAELAERITEERLQGEAKVTQILEERKEAVRSTALRKERHFAEVFDEGMASRQRTDGHKAAKLASTEKASAVYATILSKERNEDHNEKYEVLHKRAADATSRREEMMENDKTRWINTQYAQQKQASHHHKQLTADLQTQLTERWHAKLEKTDVVQNAHTAGIEARDAKLREMDEMKSAKIEAITSKRLGRHAELTQSRQVREMDATAQSKKNFESNVVAQVQKARDQQAVIAKKQHAAELNRVRDRADVEEIRRDKLATRAAAMEQRQLDQFHDRLRSHDKYLRAAHRTAPHMRALSPATRPS